MNRLTITATQGNQRRAFQYLTTAEAIELSAKLLAFGWSFSVATAE